MFLDTQKITHEIRMKHWMQIIAQRQQSGLTVKEFCAQKDIRLFEYAPTRSAHCAETFLEGFSGYLLTDDYVGYVPSRQQVIAYAGRMPAGSSSMPLRLMLKKRMDSKTP